jgi:hypothetical protein|tara:strand:- start:2166 stop:2870 length:705 start_codon:yes stop_codon:yes gene_type:complete
MLVNKKGIVDAELQTFPWEHILVDDFIEPDTYKKLLKIADKVKDMGDSIKLSRVSKYDPKFNECVFGIKHLLELGVEEEIVKLYANVLDDILSLRDTIWSKFSKHRASDEDRMFACNGHLNWTGAGGHYQIHPDSNNKTVSIIIYFDPDENNTTTLWEECSDTSACVRPEWKRNRAVLFCPHESTWHSVETTKYDRMTLACFIEFIPKERAENDDYSIEHLEFSDGYTLTQLHI